MTPRKPKTKPIQAYVGGSFVELQRTPPTGVEYPEGGPYMGQITTATFPDGAERDEVRAYPWAQKEVAEPDAPGEHNPLGLPDRWTPDLVRAWLGEAMQTLRRLPAKGCFPGSGKTSWPEWVRDVFGAYGSDDVVVTQDIDSNRRQPTILEMGRLDVALGWPYWIADVDRRKAAVFIAMGVSTRTVGRILDCSHERARQLATRSYEEIADLLNQGKLTRSA